MTPTLQRSSTNWQRILRKHNIRPSKSMGQNFLIEPSVVEAIGDTAEIMEGDLVIEVGPGMGILTRELLSRGARVVGVELDRDLARFLKNDLADVRSFSLIEQDARFVDLDEIMQGKPYQVVANLPYSAATVIIRRFMEASSAPTRMTVMVQREVAERMTAEPGSMSLLGLATDLYAESRIAFLVSPDVFLPPPKVESAVVVLEVRRELRGTSEVRNRMFELATMAFQRKRKTISNGLSMGLDRPKAEVEERLVAAHVDPMRRPQTLSVEDWLRIAEVLPS